MKEMIMDDREIQIGIQNRIHEQRSKFVYYIIALSVTAIGFSINQTSDEKLINYHIYFGIAILMWLFSIFCGFQYIQIAIKLWVANNNLYDKINFDGGLYMQKPTIFDILKAKDNFFIEFIKFSNRMNKNFNWQQIWFYFVFLYNLAYFSNVLLS